MQERNPRVTTQGSQLGVPAWVRRVGVAVLALFIVSNLALITFSWAHRGGARTYMALAILWVLATIALMFLSPLWRATVSGRARVARF
jgi:membrane protein YdbS with pleckstrin-like domain